MIPCEITFEQFKQTFKPQRNHLKNDAPLDGLMFSTDGEEKQYVETIRQQSPYRVWTVADVGAEGLVIEILSGWLDDAQLTTGYIVTSKEYEESLTVCGAT